MEDRGSCLPVEWPDFLIQQMEIFFFLREQKVIQFCAQKENIHHQIQINEKEYQIGKAAVHIRRAAGVFDV